MENFGNNSNKGKMPNVDKPKIEPVTTDVNIKSKKKFGNNFIAKDVKSSLLEVATTYWFPTFKNGLVTGIKKFVDYVFTGTSASNGNGINYNSISTPRTTFGSSLPSKPSSSFTTNKTTNINRFNDVSFNDRGKAEEVLARMIENVASYGMVSVADFWEFIGKSNEINQVDYDWGWKNLSDARVERCPEGYMIAFPKVVTLN